MDYGKRYSRLSAPLASAWGRRLLTMADKGSVIVLASAYIVSLFILACTVNGAFWKAAAVPMAVFALVSLMREVLNRPRPYESWPLDPLIAKASSGRSFPSRHMASAVIIAMELQWLWLPAGIAAWVLCAVIAFTRIAGGVHYPSDVIGAVAIAGILGFVGFYLIP